MITGREVIEVEIAALQNMSKLLDDRFEKAVTYILEHNQSRLITSGIGKAGLIANKVSATLASTGTPSFFMHPSDALHGDLGMTQEGDMILLFSNSGESEEISTLIPHLKRLKIFIIGITSNPRSTLGTQADITLELGSTIEACPHGLAPTASTTNMLAMGDALAISLMKRKNFTVSDYARYHPGGALGKKSLVVRELMRPEAKIATINLSASVFEAITAIDKSYTGSVIIINEERKLAGIFTDGDLRRLLLKDKYDLSGCITEYMITSPKFCKEDDSVADILPIFKEYRIGEMPVINADGIVTGLLELKTIAINNV